MKLSHILLLLLGVASLAGFITGVRRVSWSNGEWTFLYYHDWQRFLALGVAAFCFCWVWGLRRRAIWAWFFGCTLLVLLIIQLIWQGISLLVSAPTTPLGWWGFISQLLCALLFYGVLARWWIPKKNEFQRINVA